MKRFWILWNPASTPPTVRFDSRKEAVRVAHAMAEKYGQHFYVCRAESYVWRFTETRLVKLNGEAHTSFDSFPHGTGKS